jgi:hypothetical protein
MARKKRRASRRRQGINPMILIGVGLGVMLLIFFLLNQAPEVTENPDGSTTIATDNLDDFEAEVDSATGDCVNREGLGVGLCCWINDPVTLDLVSVPCEDTIVEGQDLQAFFTFEGGLKQSLAAFQLAIEATNTGNTDSEVRINNIVVTRTSGGDTAGVNELTTKTLNVKNVWKTAAQGQKVTWSTEPIRIDDLGTSFKMTDGTYEVQFDLQAKEQGAADGTAINVGSRTISFVVEQEQLSFSINVNQI